MSNLLTIDWKTAVDTSKPSLWIALGAITFNPLAWNIVARNEYRNKTITRIFGGNARYGCYFLAVMIFSFGILRDSLYRRALMEQPKAHMLSEPYATYVPYALIGLGQVFVITSTWALGITGTFLGDYFGILMDHRVEGFPFNVLRDPMYVGSTMSFVGGAFLVQRPAGLIVALYVYIVYMIALRYEGQVFLFLVQALAVESNLSCSQSIHRHDLLKTRCDEKGVIWLGIL